jgi:type II secretory pathway component PulL
VLTSLLSAMQRGIYAIALSDLAVEGGLVVRGEVQPAFSQTLLASGAPHPGEQRPAEPRPGEPRAAEQRASEPAAQPPVALLEAFLKQAQWETGLAVLVLPTEEVSFRRLHFEFSDPKKIRQVLPFELQHELLDSVEAHAYDTEVLRQGDGTAEVDVYLMDKARLQAIVATLERHQLSLQRVTFSAQALVQALPPTSPGHFHVYVGSEECFVTFSPAGRPGAAHSLAPHPGQLLAELRALGAGSPHDQLQALFRADAEDAERTALRERLRERLESVLEEINRLLRIHSGGEAFTVSLHGLFGELFQWQPGATSLTLRYPQGAWPGARRGHLGVLDELLGQPRNFPSSRGVNFHRRVGTWLAILRELRWPVTAAAALLLVLAGLLGSSYFLRAASLQARLDAVGQQLQRTLSVAPPITTITVNAALGRVQERLDKLRREREAVAYVDRYHYDTLRLLTDLSEAVRQQSGVSVDALTFNQERFTLSGATPSYAESDSLKTRIAAMPRFEGRTVKVTNSNVGKVIRFRLTVEK